MPPSPPRIRAFGFLKKIAQAITGRKPAEQQGGQGQKKRRGGRGKGKVKALGGRSKKDRLFVEDVSYA